MKKYEDAIRKYLTERGWDDLRPGDLAKSISIESAELLELFQWSNQTAEEVRADSEKLELIKKELADVMLYCLDMSVVLGLDTGEIVLSKLEKVKQKYPAELFVNRDRSVDPGTEDIYWQIKREHRTANELSKVTGIPSSIVIPTLNEEYQLPFLLESLRKISSPLDIIVVDGNSRDHTVDVVKKFQPFFQGSSSLRLFQVTEPGISLQRNTGASHAIHDVLIFSDADVIVPSDIVFKRILTDFTQRDYVLSAPILMPIEKGVILRLTYIIWYIVQRILLVCKKPYFAGSFIVTKKDSFDAVGGFDTNIKLAEDIDYCLRVSKKGAFGLTPVSMPVSARRFIKYGYLWIFKELPNVFQLLRNGNLKTETIFYPFGEFGGQKAHHVTNNRKN